MNKFNLESFKNRGDDMENEIGKEAIRKTAYKENLHKEFLQDKSKVLDYLEIKKLDILKEKLKEELENKNLLNNLELTDLLKKIIQSIDNTLFFNNVYKEEEKSNDLDLISGIKDKLENMYSDSIFYIKKLEWNYRDYYKELSSKINIENSKN